MKKLSETYKELGIDPTFTTEIKDDNGYMVTYSKDSGYNDKKEFDENGTEVYYEDGGGTKQGTPRSTTNQ
jgi:hypothetical protein